MVEYTLSLDTIFSSLADPTRRDILRRVAKRALSVSEIAEPYNLTFAAVSKHIKVLEKARLISKRRRGKQQLVEVSPAAVKNAADYLRYYEEIWHDRFNNLEKFLKEGGNGRD